jgi:diguanylate cyclase (GGDEF)-like protein
VGGRSLDVGYARVSVRDRQGSLPCRHHGNYHRAPNGIRNQGHAMLVLIADEDPVARASSAQAVERFGYRRVVVANGDDAWQQILERHPDVILASLWLGGVGGLELCRRVRDLRHTYASYLVALVGDHDDEGLIAAMSAGADDFLTRPVHAEQLHARLQVAERFALLHRQHADSQADLERVRRALRASSRTDSLTQLWNRSQLNDDLELFQGQLERYGHRYAAAILDLDQFRSYNDANGQLAGDEALRVVAETVARQLRTGDRAYRYGGDELVVLLPEQTSDRAKKAAARIGEAIDSLALPHAGNPPWNLLTVSVGVAAFRPGETATYDALLARAEGALLQAKASGGNRVTLAD